MIVKYPNLYFMFFSLAFSAALFPSMLGNYAGYIVPLGVGIFILDELIILTSLAFMFFQILRTQKISYKIGGYGVYILVFMLIIISLTYVSMFRADNSMEIISRDRWIILNTLVAFLPFAYKPDMKDLIIFYRRFTIFIVFLTLSKFLYLFISGPDNQWAEFGPGFLFMLSLCLAVFLWLDESRFKKVIFSLVVLVASLLSQQISAILLTLICIFIPIYFLIFQVKILSITALFFFGCVSIFLLITIDWTQLAHLLNFNPLNFMIISKLIVYWDLWNAPFIDITPIELIFGRGSGYSVSILVYNEFLDRYSIVNHSLTHNFLVTLIMKFGLLGLSFFSLIIFLTFLPLSKKFKFENSTLFKIILFLILFNFLSTPGIWKIRKGVFLWFLVGLIYFFRRYKVKSRCSK